MNAEVEALEVPPGAGRSGRCVAKVADYLFGYDLFISYSHGDGLAYPTALKAELEQAGLRVFLDQTDYVASMDLRVETRRQVRKSQKLVIVARDRALESEWVLKEVQVTLDAGEVPVVINVDGAVQRAAAESKLARLITQSEWLRIEETLEQPDSPSARTISELLRSLTHTRQNTKRSRAIMGAAALLAVAASAATWQAIEATQQRLVAERNFESARDTADTVVTTIARGLKDVEGIQTESLRKILASADKTFATLSEQHPDNASIRRSRIAMLNEFVEVHLARGETKEATAAAERSVELARVAAAKDLADRKLLGRSLLKLGDARLEVNAVDSAEAAYGEALRLRHKLHQENPSDLESARDVAVALARSADVDESRKDWAQASKVLEQSVSMRRALVSKKPEWRRDLGVALTRLADMRLEQKQTASAREALTEAADLFQAMRTEDPGSTRAMKDHAVGLQRIGNLEKDLGNWAAARAAYEQSGAALKALSARDKTNLEWRRDVSVAEGKIASVLASSGDVPAATAALERLIAERKALIAASPQAAHLQRDLEEAEAELAKLKAHEKGRPKAASSEPSGRLTAA